MGFLYLEFKKVQNKLHVMFHKMTPSDHLDREYMSVDSQFDYNGAGFDLIHFHEGKTFCASKPLFRFVVLEFKEDSCSWKMRNKRVNNYLTSSDPIFLQQNFLHTDTSRAQ